MALRSIQSEMSNVFSTLPVLRTKSALPLETLGVNYDINAVKLLMIIPYIIHINRYYRNFKESYSISKKQKDLYLLNVLDYVLIYLHAKNQNNTIMYSIISGCISFFFIYSEYPVSQKGRTKGIANPIMDIPMIIFSIAILYKSTEPNMHFFAIRELTYHILEMIVYY
jgi:hypothetical protein